MAVVIAEIVTEIVVAPESDGGTSARADVDIDAVVRQATERVLEILRREWDQ